MMQRFMEGMDKKNYYLLTNNTNIKEKKTSNGTPQQPFTKQCKEIIPECLEYWKLYIRGKKYNAILFDLKNIY